MPMTVPHAESGQRRTVLMQVGAAPSELPPLRAVASDLAVRAEFDLDAVADLRLAVDEAAAELVALALPDSMLTCRFVLRDEHMEITISVPAEETATVHTNTFGWRVLSTLADEVNVHHEREDRQPVVAITLRKQRLDTGSVAVGK